jgi:hypothetical protein
METENGSDDVPYDEAKPPMPTDHRRQIAQVPPAMHSRRSRGTDDTSSDIHSAFSSDGAYEVIEYDFPADGGTSSDFFPEMGNLRISEDSPAAAALRANAGVHVSSVGKVARAVHMQSVRRVLKRAAGKSKSGNVRGKPPRVPPKIVTSPLPAYMEDHPDEGEEEEDESDSTHNSPPKKPPAYSNNTPPASAELGEMDESSQSAFASRKESDGQLQLDRDTMHIPDGVAPGTVEAGKKGSLVLTIERDSMRCP